jgi:hypothetical protein
LLKIVTFSIVTLSSTTLLASNNPAIKDPAGPTILTLHYTNVPTQGLDTTILVYAQDPTCKSGQDLQQVNQINHFSIPSDTTSTPLDSSTLTSWIGSSTKGCITLKLVCGSNILSPGLYSLESSNNKYTSADPSQIDFDLSRCSNQS